MCLTTEQDDDDDERYMKNTNVVECRRAKGKHLFILQNNLSSNRMIALNINTKAVNIPSIFTMDWHVAR